MRFQGIKHGVRAIINVMKPDGRQLNSEEVSHNANIASNSITFERFFGREVALQAFLERILKLSEEHYDVISKICRDLTNFYAINNHLWREEETHVQISVNIWFSKASSNGRLFFFQQQYSLRKIEKLYDCKTMRFTLITFLMS